MVLLVKLVKTEVAFVLDPVVLVSDHLPLA